MSDSPIYLDYNATTPIHPEVKVAMLPHIEKLFGNPSSGHAYGLVAREAVDQARRQVANLLGAEPDEIVFTSGGSESNNHAIKGVAFAARPRGTHIITAAIEHPAVLNTCRYLSEFHGFDVTYIPVDELGQVDPRIVEAAICPETALITIMHSNNEMGTIQPLPEISALAHERGILFHTDAAQSVGKVPVNVDELGVDLLTVAGHKAYAPKGIGALYVRKGTLLHAFIHGAGHENGRRAGTENVPYIVGLGKASELAHGDLDRETARLRMLRDRLHLGLQQGFDSLGYDEVKLNGHPEMRLPNTLNISLPGLDGNELLARTPQIAASTGSACHAGETEPSPVLTAMGLGRARALTALRLSVGRFTTEDEVDRAAKLILDGMNS